MGLGFGMDKKQMRTATTADMSAVRKAIHMPDEGLMKEVHHKGKHRMMK